MGYFNSSGDYVPRTLIGPRERRDRAVSLGFTACVGLSSLLAILAVAPFAWMLITSVRPSREIFQFPAEFWPTDFHFETYTDALKRVPFARYLFNSLFTCLSAVFLQLFLSACAAYA